MTNLVTKYELKLLEPYLLGETAREDGEWDMFCPLHEDSNRSASLNVQKAIWRCHAGCGGGPIGQLIDQKLHWIKPTNGYSHGRVNGHANGNVALPTAGKVAGWTAALLANTDNSLLAFKEKRGIYETTIKEYGLGWDINRRAYTIPIYSRSGELVNVRRYQIELTRSRKIWGMTGHNGARLYPYNQLKNDVMIVCEGELDALATIQAGYGAITRTASASTWSRSWNKLFNNKVVYLCHDCDEAGQAANQKVGNALVGVAKEIRVLHLPYGVVEKHGKDLSDFWMEHDDHEFERLLEKAMLFGDARLSAERLPEDARVIDALDSRRSRTPLRLTGTIEGKVTTGYTIPKRMQLTCNMDAGDKCEACPLKDAQGMDEWELGGDDAALEVMDIDKPKLKGYILADYGAMCKRPKIFPMEEQAVETLFIRPSIDHSLEEQDYTTLRVRHLGGHDTPANETVQLLGALYPSPKSQANEFLAWEVNPMETSIDRFELDEETIGVLTRFRPKEGHSSLKKLRLIAREFETNVTHIYGRTEMHMAMDLTWHSGLIFEFDRQQMERGWLELLVVGDTRTGKSEAARLLARHLGAGEVVSCETASLPGILGAVQQPTGSQWAITWGKIPLNDRRCVVLDEIDGLHPHDIASLSHLRSSGVAEISKVKAGRTHARTRLIWLGNPRKGRMADYTFGIEALEPLIGKPEDIARFDLVMTVAVNEVSSDVMNMPHSIKENPRYTPSACNLLLRWAWSRRKDNIKFTAEAEARCFELAKEMGTRYTENPPLVQAANVRIKIARVAVAFALRTFSTDETYENCIVTEEHINSAVHFMDTLYSMPGFGYSQRSQNQQARKDVALEHYDRAFEYMKDEPQLAVFLRDTNQFKPWDIMSYLGVEQTTANGIISRLFGMNMVEGGGDGFVRPTPQLRDILRRIK